MRGIYKKININKKIKKKKKKKKFGGGGASPSLPPKRSAIDNKNFNK